jgi:DNA-binding MarR family transcriptional regulator
VIRRYIIVWPRPGDAFTEIVTRGLLLGALLEEAGDALTAADGQSAARWKVLGVIAKQERTVAKIALSLKLSRQAVQRVADVLAADGLVEYLDNPDDRRANLLALTSQGRNILSAIRVRQCRWANKMGARLSGDDLLTIRTSLQKLIDILEDSG